MHYGVALKISSARHNSSYIINSYYSTEVELGKVAIGTNHLFNEKVCMGMKKLILYYTDTADNKVKAVIADIESIKISSKKSIPEDFKKFIPLSMVAEEQKNWFLVKNIRICSDKELDNYVLSNNKLLRSIFDYPKISKIYFSDTSLIKKLV